MYKTKAEKREEVELVLNSSTKSSKFGKANSSKVAPNQALSSFINTNPPANSHKRHFRITCFGYGLFMIIFIIATWLQHGAFDPELTDSGMKKFLLEQTWINRNLQEGQIWLFAGIEDVWRYLVGLDYPGSSLIQL